MNHTHKLITGSFMFLLLAAAHANAASLLVETEAFTTRGGWVLDAQFVDIMGSPYLMAHGLGVPVADAVTTVTLPTANAIWRVWVRTRDWTPDFNGTKPGRFRVSINGTDLAPEFGTAPADWGWADGGAMTLSAATLEIRLRDLTGFNGRCDAIYLTTDTGAAAPPAAGSALEQWRAQQHGETIAPADTADFDLVVVGGGLAGCSSAIAAARSGLHVAFVQDRPVLGGNASQEIRVSSEGARRYQIVDEIDTLGMGNRSAASISHDASRLAVIQGEPNITLLMPWRAYAAGTNAAHRITHVDIRDTATGARKRLTAPLFVDATGDGWIGYWAGADYRTGREARDEHNEPLAPLTSDQRTMGSSLMWTSKTGDDPVDFPTDLPWTTAVAETRAATGGAWEWEYGINPTQDTIWDAEHIRDHLLRAIYGNFANAKLKPENANRSLDWVPYVAGKRESRRFLGPYILTQQDVLTGRYFEDAVAYADWGIDLHSETAVSYIASATNHGGRDTNTFVPYRCLFSRNVPNLFLAGRNASVTHVGLGSPRVMNTLGQFGVAIGYAAKICKDNVCDPIEVYRDAAKFDALRALLSSNTIGAATWPVNPLFAPPPSSIIDNDDKTRFWSAGEWLTSSSESTRWGANYLHNSGAPAGDKFALYWLNTPVAGDYTVSLWNSLSGSRSTSVPVWVFTNGTANVSPNAQGEKNDPQQHGGGDEFLIGRDVNPYKHYRGYLRFDLSSLPPAAWLASVDLSLTVSEPDLASENGTAGADGITVHQLTEAFDPATVSWANRAADTPWATSGGTFDPTPLAVMHTTADIPYPPNVKPGQTYTFPATNPALFQLVQNIQTNPAVTDKTLHLVVRIPALELVYNSRKIYHISRATLNTVWADTNAAPTLHINLMQQQAQWRDIGTYTAAAGDIRVMIGTTGTTGTVTADAARADLIPAGPAVDLNDYDGNGLPNDWERRWFLQETGTDPDADPDGDGQTNLEEFQNGTNPLDPKSRREFGTLLQISSR